MNEKEKLISNLHKSLRNDKYINELCNAYGIEFDTINDLLVELYNQFWFDSMTWGADKLAKDMNLKFRTNMTVEEKQSQVTAKWRSKGKVDLQAICDSWKNGEIKVSFEDSTINLKFVGEHGIPSDLVSLKTEINKAKPAHLLVDYLFSYILVPEMNTFKLSELETLTLDKFAFKTK